MKFQTNGTCKNGSPYTRLVMDTFLNAAIEGSHTHLPPTNLPSQLLKKAGAIVREAFNDREIRGEAEFKTSAADVVTQTDKAVEKFIFGFLRERFPDHLFIGEETYEGSGTTLTDSKTWIVDPVDGTTNFVHGFPFVAVSIALVENKEPIIGVVYNPILDELFSAAKGHGAFMNKRPLPLFKPVVLNDIATSLLATEYGYDRDERMDLKLKGIRTALTMPCRGIRSLGSAALEACYVARGALDAYWEAGVHAWDVAAGAIIVREAGGAAINFFPPANHTSDDAMTEFLDLQSREFVFVRAMPDGAEGVNRVVKSIRGCVKPMEYARD